MEPYAQPPTLDVGRLSLDDLQSLQERVDQAIQRQREEKQHRALETIAQLVEDAGLSPDMVMKRITAKPRRGARKLPAKYRDPDNPKNAWAGRGKRPKWLEAKLAAGAKLEDFAVATTTEVTRDHPGATAP